MGPDASLASAPERIARDSVRRRRLARHRQSLWIAVFLLPALFFFGLIYAIPMVTMIVTSFTEWNGVGEFRFIGFDNYADLFHDSRFRLAVRNSLLWALIAALIHVPLGVFAALVLHRRPPGWRFVRTTSLLPNLIPPAALALLYLLIFNPGIGLLNQLLSKLGFGEVQVFWLFGSTTAFIAVTSTWVFYVGVIILITMAELARIPPDLREAALLDGASERQIDWYVNLPLLRNIIAVGIVIAVSEVFKLFDPVFLTTGGGPDNQTMSLGLLIYNEAGLRFEFGSANAVGVVLLVMGLLAFFLIGWLFRLHERMD